MILKQSNSMHGSGYVVLYPHEGFSFVHTFLGGRGRGFRFLPVDKMAARYLVRIVSGLSEVFTLKLFSFISWADDSDS